MQNPRIIVITGLSSSAQARGTLPPGPVIGGTGLGRGALVAELGDVGARHECPVAGPGEHDHPDLRVGLQGPQRRR